ncbi:WD40-repeat-containing domain protein [Daedaleopsis nitida]|nr:WD40-repeat-containing domain protein [Daedaleopsis nitida]
MHRGYGYPLWHPEPPKGIEVQIGDVGFLRSGAFWRLFNATKDDDAPQNAENGVPDSYSPFHINQTLLARQQNVIEGNLTSVDVEQFDIEAEAGSDLVPVGAGMRFSCKAEQGAFVVVREPAQSSSLHPSKSLVHYIRMNIEKWHALATARDLDIPKESLYFISGVVKTNDWGLGAFLGNGTSCEVSVQAQASSFAHASFSLRATKGHYGNTEVRSRPKSESERTEQAPPSPLPSIESQGETSSLGRSSIDSGSIRGRTEMDQCLFFHYYRVKKRFWINRVIRANAGADERDSDRTGDGGDITHVDEYDVIEESRCPDYDPVDHLLDYILDYVMDDGSQVQVAVGSDTHLYALFEGEFPKDIAAALDKLKPPVMFLDDEGEGEFEERAAWAQRARNTLHTPITGMDSNVVAADTGKGREEHRAQDDDENGEPGSSKVEDETKDENRPAVGDDEQATQPVILQEHTGGVTCVAFSPDGRYIASGSEDMSIILRDGNDGSVIATLANHEESVWTLAFSPDSKRLASGSSDGFALIWDVEQRSVVAVLDRHNGVVQTIAYSPDGTKIVTSSVDFTVRLWDANTGELLHKMEDHRAVVMSAVFSPDGRWIASCGADYTAKIWDAETGQLHRSLEEHAGVVWSVAFSPDSRRVVTGSDDTTSRIWNAETGDELVILREHHGPVWSVSFSPDPEGKYVMSASNDATIKICDSYSGERVHAFDRHDTLVNAAVFSPDGEYVASSAGDNAVMVWNTKTGVSLPQMTGHLDKVTGLQFSPKSNRVVSCSDDGTVRIWTIPDPVQVQAQGVAHEVQ